MRFLKRRRGEKWCNHTCSLIASNTRTHRWVCSWTSNKMHMHFHYSIRSTWCQWAQRCRMKPTTNQIRLNKSNLSLTCLALIKKMLRMLQLRTILLKALTRLCSGRQLVEPSRPIHQIISKPATTSNTSNMSLQNTRINLYQTSLLMIKTSKSQLLMKLITMITKLPIQCQLLSWILEKIQSTTLAYKLSRI